MAGVLQGREIEMLKNEIYIGNTEIVIMIGTMIMIIAEEGRETREF